jgi:hypothetical protein
MNTSTNAIHTANPPRFTRSGFLLAAAAILLSSPCVLAQVAQPRDGQRDFDFLVGSWKIHLKRLVQPEHGAKEWVDLDGTVVCRHVFDGRAEVEEFNVESRDKKMHIQGLATRFYNPNYINGASGGPTPRMAPCIRRPWSANSTVAVANSMIKKL